MHCYLEFVMMPLIEGAVLVTHCTLGLFFKINNQLMNSSLLLE